MGMEPVNQITGHKLNPTRDSWHCHHGRLCCSLHRQPMSGVNSWTHQVGLSRTRPDKIVLIIQVFKVALCADLGSSQELDFPSGKIELSIIRTF